MPGHTKRWDIDHTVLPVFSLFPTSLFYELILPRGLLRSNWTAPLYCVLCIICFLIALFSYSAFKAARVFKISNTKFQLSSS